MKIKSAALEEVIRLQEETQAAIEKAGKSAVLEAFQSVFAAVPEIVGFCWTQYTPHFNDGEPCVFSRHDFEVMLAPKAGEAGEAADEDGDNSDYGIPNGVSSYQLEDVAKKRFGAIRGGKVYRALETVEKFFSPLEDLFESVFGDGVQVTVTPRGVTVEEYSHD